VSVSPREDSGCDAEEDWKRSLLETRTASKVDAEAEAWESAEAEEAEERARSGEDSRRSRRPRERGWWPSVSGGV
jgi:hypothetical protein